jgi:hypothetical protein
MYNAKIPQDTIWTVDESARHPELRRHTGPEWKSVAVNASWNNPDRSRRGAVSNAPQAVRGGQHRVRRNERARAPSTGVARKLTAKMANRVERKPARVDFLQAIVDGTDNRAVGIIDQVVKVQQAFSVTSVIFEHCVGSSYAHGFCAFFELSSAQN